MKIFKTISVALLVASTLIACGGGGGGGGSTSQSSSQTVTSTDTFQFRAANAAASQQTSSLSFTITGLTNSGAAITGSGTISRSELTSTSFEGVTALAQTSTTDSTITVNGTTEPRTTRVTSYSDSNYLPLGTGGAEYEVVNGVANIPAAVLVNDSGTVYVANRYSSTTKSTFLGTDTVTYSIQPDAAHTALVKFTYTYRDENSVIGNTDVSTFRMTPSGGITYISSVSSNANGNLLTLTFQ